MQARAVAGAVLGRRAAPRGLALFLGAFLAVNVVGGVLRPGFDASLWLVDLRLLPGWAAAVSLGLTGVLLIAWGARPAAGRVRAAVTRGMLLAGAAVTAVNAANVVALALRGAVGTSSIPLSVVVAVAFVVVERAVARREATTRPAWGVAPWACTFAALFAVGQMVCFGRTDYRRDADAIVVFGARAYADGRPSTALADRVRTACALYREGRAPLVVLSGGPGDGAFHETDVMRAIALAGGVPAEAIVIDTDGRSTRATVENAARTLHDRGLRTALVVSHAYHLPRVRMACDRAGIVAYSVPAQETRVIAAMPLFMAREVAALWAYYLVPPRNVCGS